MQPLRAALFFLGSCGIVATSGRPARADTTTARPNDATTARPNDTTTARADDTTTARPNDTTTARPNDAASALANDATLADDLETRAKAEADAGRNEKAISLYERSFAIQEDRIVPALPDKKARIAYLVDMTRSKLQLADLYLATKQTDKAVAIVNAEIKLHEPLGADSKYAYAVPEWKAFVLEQGKPDWDPPGTGDSSSSATGASGDVAPPKSPGFFLAPRPPNVAWWSVNVGVAQNVISPSGGGKALISTGLDFRGEISALSLLFESYGVRSLGLSIYDRVGATYSLPINGDNVSRASIDYTAMLGYRTPSFGFFVGLRYNGISLIQDNGDASGIGLPLAARVELPSINRSRIQIMGYGFKLLGDVEMYGGEAHIPLYFPFLFLNAGAEYVAGRAEENRSGTTYFASLGVGDVGKSAPEPRVSAPR